jgi:hypothetical protein
MICAFIFCVAKFFTLTKFLNGIQLIIVGEALYQLMFKSLYLQLYNAIFFTYGQMNLIYQLKIITKKWSMVFEVFWMSILVGWCFRWM